VSDPASRVLAPCAGRLVPMADTPDPVFAAEMVGPGVAIDPELDATTVVAPVAGKLLKVLPHAFVVLRDDGVGILVHLGINTVRLDGRGFDVLAQQGDLVDAGSPVVRWDPGFVAGLGATGGRDISPLVIVVAMDQPKGSVPAPEPGTSVVTGDPLFDVDP
jgi:PTS system glucose-specific IIA component